MSTEERRALAIIVALIVLTGAARWLERPRPVLEDVPAVDLAVLEAASRGAAAGRAAPAVIDPNTATAAELERLPGVGPTVAGRIVAARAQAPFRTLEDLRRVPGIGASLLGKIAPHVSLKSGGPGTRPAGINGSFPTPSHDTGKLDLNRADAAALDRLDGVGPALAARLVARRDSLGRFRSWDEVDAVTGVGPAMLARLRQMSVLDP